MEEVKNILANQRTGWPQWISNQSKELQHFFRVPGGTFALGFVTRGMKWPRQRGRTCEKFTTYG